MRTSRWVTAAVLFTGVVALAWAQPGQGFGFGGGGPVFLVINKAVQEDIKATDDQVTKLSAWAKEEGQKIAEMRKEKLAGADFKSEEGRAKIAEFNAEANKLAYADLEKANILKPEQLKRVHQIDRQNQGLRAFTNPDVVAALKLTDDQKAKIKGIVDENQKDAQAIRQEAGFGGKGGNKGMKIEPAKLEEMNKKLDKINTSAMAKVNDVLTAEQKTAWKEMTGEPFDVSKLRQFGPPKKDEE
jgi:hypothetical protein